MKTRKVQPQDWENLAKALGLTAIEAHDAFPSLAVLVCKPNTRVVREGEPGVDVYVIASGEAQVSRSHMVFFDKSVATLRAGDFFGEIGFLVEQGRSATVTTRTAAEIYRILADEMHTQVQARADLRMRLEEAARSRIQALSDAVAKK